MGAARPPPLSNVAAPAAFGRDFGWVTADISVERPLRSGGTSRLPDVALVAVVRWQRGFGPRLLEHGLAMQAGIVPNVGFEPEGLCCTLRLPKHQLSGSMSDGT